MAKRKNGGNQNELRDIFFSYKIKAKPKGEKQKNLVKKIKENDIVFITGPAGTGKSFVSLMTALEMIKDPSNNINKILLTKPIVESGNSIGYLPGTAEEKVEPYMFSLYSIIEKLIDKQSASQLLKNDYIQVVPLTFMRGVTFDNSIVILDEGQNTTVTSLKLFITRLGFNSKMIITGDILQTDLKLRSDERSGLHDATERFQNIKGVGFQEFDEKDILRHSILTEIIKRYDVTNG